MGPWHIITIQLSTHLPTHSNCQLWNVFNDGVSSFKVYHKRHTEHNYGYQWLFVLEQYLNDWLCLSAVHHNLNTTGSWGHWSICNWSNSQSSTGIIFVHELSLTSFSCLINFKWNTFFVQHKSKYQQSHNKKILRSQTHHRFWSNQNMIVITAWTINKTKQLAMHN